VIWDSPDDDEGVVSVLEDRAGEVIHEGVEEKAFPGGLEDHLLQDVNNDIEQEGGKRVTLPKPAAALDPSAGDTIKEDRSSTRVI
jgi:hypothetical protein